jgi:hypothetical protein
MNTLMMLYRDAALLFRDLHQLTRYARSSESIHAGIALFSTPSYHVKRGAPASDYHVHLVNATQHTLTRVVKLEVLRSVAGYPVGPPLHSFMKALYLQAESTMETRFMYDWVDSATFIINDVHTSPDESFFSESPVNGNYALRATLADPDGRIDEELYILQELTG